MALLIPFAVILRLWFASFRIQLPSEVVERARTDPRGIIFILWHNRVFGTNEIHRRLRKGNNRLVGLFSGSRDGAWLAALFRLLGMGAVRGSQNRRGAAGAREILGVVRSGFDTGFTVDGSRGPVYQAKEGVTLVAQKSGAPVVFVAPVYHQALRANSWDGFFIPLPFCRIECRMEMYESMENFAPGADRKAATEAITRKLNQLAAGTDPRFGI